jgi:hypothetical protein
MYLVRVDSVAEPVVVKTARVAEWVKDLEVPVKVSVTVPGVAFAAAAMVTVFGVPAFKVKACGVAETPADCPLTSTATGDEKPFTAETETETPVELPIPIVADTGFSAIVKSGVGVGGSVCCVPPPPPPPQPAAIGMIENAPRIRNKWR